MRPAQNFEPKYRVTMLTQEEWTKEPGFPPVVKGLSGIKMGPECRRGMGLQPMSNPRVTFSLVWQCQRALNISTHNSVGFFWVPGHSGICGNEIADELAREGSVHQFVRPQPALGVSRQNTRKMFSVALLNST
jgi:hypothetical protein